MLSASVTPASVNDRKPRVRSVGKNRCVEAVRPIRNLLIYLHSTVHRIRCCPRHQTHLRKRVQAHLISEFVGLGKPTGAAVTPQSGTERLASRT